MAATAQDDAEEPSNSATQSATSMPVLFDVGPSEAGHTVVSSEHGHRLLITGLSLVDPASAAGQSAVTVWLEIAGHDEAYLIGRLSREAPIAAVPPVLLYGDGFVLRHDRAAATVRLYGELLVPVLVSGGDGDEEEEGDQVEGVPVEDEEDELEEEEEGAAMVEYEPYDEDVSAELYDSDNGEDDGEEEAEQPRKPREGDAAGESSGTTSGTSLTASPAAGSAVVPEREFLGPASSASVKNTAGFMRVAAAEAGAAAGGGQPGGNKEIVVLYRYTRFSRTWSGRRGVEPCRRTKLHRLRFAVPAAGDAASSLAWAGAALGPLIYPPLFRRQLQELWSSLAAPPPAAVTGAIVPPRAARLQVVVDVGILRREDHTPERMEHMLRELEAMARDAWPPAGRYHVAMELHLPEPVSRGLVDEEAGEGDGERPAKRRRIAAAAEECSVCLEPMASGGAAAWPGCGHVFHGECVEKTVAVSEMCPLCRHKLSDTLSC